MKGGTNITTRLGGNTEPCNHLVGKMNENERIKIS